MLRGRSTSLESAQTPVLSSTNHTYRILSEIIQSLELSSSHLEEEGIKKHLIDLLSSISLHEIQLNPEEEALISQIQENQGNVEENLIQELILKMNEHLASISRGPTPARQNTFSPWAAPLEVEEKKIILISFLKKTHF